MRTLAKPCPAPQLRRGGRQDDGRVAATPGQGPPDHCRRHARVPSPRKRQADPAPEQRTQTLGRRPHGPSPAPRGEPQRIDTARLRLTDQPARPSRSRSEARWPAWTRTAQLTQACDLGAARRLRCTDDQAGLHEHLGQALHAPLGDSGQVSANGAGLLRSASSVMSPPIHRQPPPGSPGYAGGARPTLVRTLPPSSKP